MQDEVADEEPSKVSADFDSSSLDDNKDEL